MRLIDADKEINELYKLELTDEKDKQSVRFSILVLTNAPTVEERQTAKWIKQGHGIGYRCSNCGKIVLADDSNELNYCCNCGAKMRGGTK